MLGYVLVEDILDEMLQNISYIKLNSYAREGKKKQFPSFFVEKELYLLYNFYRDDSMKKLLVLFITLLVATGCGKETDGEKFKREYEKLNGEIAASGEEYLTVDINKNNVIKYSMVDEIIAIVQDGTGVIYLGYPECPWCRNVVEPLLEAADSTALETIYYLNMRDIRDRLSLDSDGNVVVEVEEKEGYYDLVEALSAILDDYILTSTSGETINTGKKRIYVPIVIFVKNGDIVSYHADTVATQIDPYVELTEEENNELVNIYKEAIMKVIDLNYCSEDEERCQRCKNVKEKKIR